MDSRILVAYASRCGATAEVAEAIGGVLSQAGAEVDVCPVRKVKDLTAYRGVVAGSAIRMGRLLPEAVKFIRRHQPRLVLMPVAWFAVGISLRQDTEEKRQGMLKAVQPVRDVFEPVDVGLFAGKLDRSKLPLIWRCVVNLARVPDGDFRDWDAIRAWAAGLAAGSLADALRS